MARKAKPPRPSAPPFSTARAPLREAFARAKASLGSHRLAERDLLEHMRSGRLAMAERRIAGDGAVLFTAVAPSFFATAVLTARSGDVEIVEIGALIAGPSGVEATTDETSGFRARFVARSGLDKLYPVNAAADQETEASSPRRKPGKRPKYDWPLVVAAELIRRAKAGEKDPTALKMIEFCEAEMRYSPGLKEMQLLRKKLLLG